MLVSSLIAYCTNNITHYMKYPHRKMHNYSWYSLQHSIQKTHINDIIQQQILKSTNIIHFEFFIQIDYDEYHDSITINCIYCLFHQYSIISILFLDSILLCLLWIDDCYSFNKLYHSCRIFLTTIIDTSKYRFTPD